MLTNSIGDNACREVPYLQLPYSFTFIGRIWYNNILEICWNHGVKYEYFSKNTRWIFMEVVTVLSWFIEC